MLICSSFIHSLIHSYNKYFLGTHYESSNVLEAGVSTVDKTGHHPVNDTGCRPVNENTCESPQFQAYFLVGGYRQQAKQIGETYSM